MVGAEAVNGLINAAVNHLQDYLADIVLIEHLIALAVDKLSLTIHNVVILKDALSDGEVPALYLLLRAFDHV